MGCAKAFIAESVRVVINGRHAERGHEAARALGKNARFIQADITHPSERERLFNEARNQFGPISILVTNADGPTPGAFMSTSQEDWQNAFDMVMQPAMDMIRRCIPSMIEDGYGRVINISSISAKETTLGAPLANGLRSGLIGALGTLAREIGESGVTVNSLLAGSFDTDLLRRVASHHLGRPHLSPEEAVTSYAEQGPMKRLGTIEEFGALCAFLASRQAGYITGQSIVIDGGRVPTLL